MRVLFLTLYPESAASPRYRVHQFIPGLRALGIDCAVRAPLSAGNWARLTGPDRVARPFWYHARETPARIKQLVHARSFDLVVVQKALLTAPLRGMGTLLAAAAPRYIYDIDDAVHLAPPHPLRLPWSLFEDRRQNERIMRRARLVLAGNEWLAGEAVRIGASRVELFPTVVDTDRFTPPAAPAPGFRLGWIGSPATTPSLEIAAEALRGGTECDVALVGADPARVHWPGALLLPWNLDTEVDAVRQFSVGLVPLHPDPWTRGKCALKALLCMACGAPCIASPFGAVQSIIEHGVNGLYAATPMQWRAAVDRLRDPAERNRMGAAARATVEDRFSLRGAVPRLARLLESAR